MLSAAVANQRSLPGEGLSEVRLSLWQRFVLSIGVIAVCGLIAVGLPVAFFFLPQHLVRACPANDKATVDSGRCLTAEQRFKAQSDVRTTGVQALGGLVVFMSAALGGYFTWQQLRLGRRQLQESIKATELQSELGRNQLQLALESAQQEGALTRQQLQQSWEGTRKEHELVQQGQHTERFRWAIDQLGNNNLDIRLGGIYALEGIARQSEDHHRSVMEILATYLRRHSPWPPSRAGQYTEKAPIEAVPDLPIRAADVQAVITVISRRRWQHDERDGLPSLANLDLRRAYLKGAHLHGVNLQGVHLERALLSRAHLERANLWRAYLGRAFLIDAHLEGAQLASVRLENALLMGAVLTGANLRNAHLEGAFLDGASLVEATLSDAFLQGAQLTNARLSQAILEEARLDGADIANGELREANLSRAYLNEANLQGAQLNRANLQGAQLNRANLQGAQLNRANLQGAQLNRANLQGAQLNRANLQGAQLNGANLQGAQLKGTSLKGAIGLTQEQLDSTFTDEVTELPAELKAPRQTQ